MHGWRSSILFITPGHGTSAAHLGEAWAELFPLRRGRVSRSHKKTAVQMLNGHARVRGGLGVSPFVVDSCFLPALLRPCWSLRGWVSCGRLTLRTARLWARMHRPSLGCFGQQPKTKWQSHACAHEVHAHTSQSQPTPNIQNYATYRATNNTNKKQALPVFSIHQHVIHGVQRLPDLLPTDALPDRNLLHRVLSVEVFQHPLEHALDVLRLVSGTHL
jgi:hypothetical protein